MVPRHITATLTYRLTAGAFEETSPANQRSGGLVVLFSLIHSRRTGHSRHSDTVIYNFKTVTLVSFVVRIILLASAILINIATPIRRGSEASRLLGLRVRIPPGCMDVCLL